MYCKVYLVKNNIPVLNFTFRNSYKTCFLYIIARSDLTFTLSLSHSRKSDKNYKRKSKMVIHDSIYTIRHLISKLTNQSMDLKKGVEVYQIKITRTCSCLQIKVIYQWLYGGKINVDDLSHTIKIIKGKESEEIGILITRFNYYISSCCSEKKNTYWIKL